MTIALSTVDSDVLWIKAITLAVVAVAHLQGETVAVHPRPGNAQAFGAAEVGGDDSKESLLF